MKSWQQYIGSDPESFKLCNDGMTRFVILTRRYAFKFPRFWWNWFWFLMGCISNLSERSLWRGLKKLKRDERRICPILFADPFGLLVVMPRCREITNQEMPDAEQFIGLPLDYSRRNMGRMRDGRIVLVDYSTNGKLMPEQKGP